jgi:hypothetical protein
MLAKLSKVFQFKFIVVSSVGQIVKIEIVSICICFLLDNCDLNQETFNEFSGCHIMLEFGSLIDYLWRLPSK